MAQRPQPSLRFADGGSFITRWAQSVMRPDAAAKRLREADAPPPQAPPPAPVRPPAPPPPPPNPNATPDNPAGIRFQDGGGLSKEAVMAAIARQRAERPQSGGSGTQPQVQAQVQPTQPAQGQSVLRDFLRNPGSVLRERERKAELGMQDGGHVPGTGEGDKIPAKYEPGEFVVSNDMIDDNPGLREGLSQMRAETLAARGRTVEEADAKALRYHGGLRGGEHGQETGNEELQGVRRHAERGVEGVGDSTAYARRSGSGRGEGLQRVTLRAAEGFPGIDVTERPWQGSADSRLFARDPGPGNPNVGRAAPPVAAPIEPAAPAAPAAPKAPGAASRLLGSADDWKNFASGPADSPYKTLRMTPPSAPSGAPGMAGKAAGVLGKAAGVAQGAVGVYDAYKGIQEGDAQRAGVGAADALAAGALFTPAAPVAGAYLGLRGAWDTGKAIYDNLGEGAQNVIGGAVNQVGLNTGLWGVDDSAKMQLDAAAPKPADTLRKSTPGAASNPTDRRVAAGSQTPPAPATAPPNPGGVTRNGNEYSGTDVRGPITINGFAPGAGLNLGSGPNAQNMAAADALADTQQRESMARVQAGMQAQPQQPSEAASLRQQATNMLASRELGSRKNARLLLETANNMEQSADRRYGADTSLRGTMYSADAQLGGKQMDSQRRLREQQLTGMLWRESGGDPSKFQSLAMQYGLADTAKLGGDMAQTEQSRAQSAATSASKRLEGLAVRDDGKGGSVVDPGRLAQLNSTLTKMAPGWQSMGEKEQATLLGKAEASVNLLEGLNDRRNNGFLQSIGWDGTSPSLDKLPDMAGAKLSAVGLKDGALTGGGVSRGDYVIEVNGQKLYLPRSKVNQGELELLKSRGVDVRGAQN